MGRKKLDYTGKKFGEIVVLWEQGGGWLCQCSCGNRKVISHKHVGAEDTISCGCVRNRRMSESLTIHGMYGTPTYGSWQSMLERCRNPKSAGYHRYGGRGITVCERWLDSFQNFFDDMGLRPEGKTLDRFPDNNGNYEPGNCRWATRKEQSNNRSIPQQLLPSVVGAMMSEVSEGKHIAKVARKYGVGRTTIYRYLKL